MKQELAGVSRETLRHMLVDALPALGFGYPGFDDRGAGSYALEGIVPLSEQQIDALLDYVGLLLKWNKVYNLTAVRNPVDMLGLHILDCLSVQPVMRRVLNEKRAMCYSPADETRPLSLLDVGAGAGLPGLVLAILNPDWSVTLVDAVQKKVAFMTQAIAQLKLPNAKAVHGRIEQLQHTVFDAAISRAFSDLEPFVTLALPHLSPHACLFAMQGKADDRLLPPFQQKILHRLSVPGLDAQRHLLILDHRKD